MPPFGALMLAQLPAHVVLCVWLVHLTYPPLCDLWGGGGGGGGRGGGRGAGAGGAGPGGGQGGGGSALLMLGLSRGYEN